MTRKDFEGQSWGAALCSLLPAPSQAQMNRIPMYGAVSAWR